MKINIYSEFFYGIYDCSFITDFDCVVLQFEEAISKSPQDACYYAEKIIKGRWPIGEEAIAKDSFFALKYAMNVIKGPWPEGEAAIATYEDWKNIYINNFGIKI